MLKIVKSESMLALGLLVFGAVFLGACFDGKDICKKDAPPPGTVLPAGSTCAKECGKGQGACLSCCTHTNPGQDIDNPANGSTMATCVAQCNGVVATIKPLPEITVAIIRKSTVGGDYDAALRSFSDAEAAQVNAAIACMSTDGWGKIDAALTALLPTAESAMKVGGYDPSNSGDRSRFLVDAAVTGAKLYGNTSGKCAVKSDTASTKAAAGGSQASW